MQAIFDEFDDYLALQCGRSAHTRRAYLGDLRSLFAFLDERAPGTGLPEHRRQRATRLGYL